MLESLENRRLMTVGSVSLSDGWLNVTGTPANDVITVDYISSVNSISVNLNGTLRFFAPSTVNFIKVDTGDGHDRVTSFDRKVMHLYGRGGNDTLRGGGNGNVVLGGEGPDSLYGGIGRDHLLGEAGDDYIEGGAGNDDLRGGTDNDTLVGGSGQDDMTGNEGNDLYEARDGEIDRLIVYPRTPGAGLDTIKADSIDMVFI